MFTHMLKRFKNYAENGIQPYYFGELISLDLLHNTSRLNQTYTAVLNAQDHAIRNTMWCYLRAALRGDKDAQYIMGMSYLNAQLGLDRSYMHAEKWLEQAAHQGHERAKKQLQEVYNKIVFS